MYCKLKETYFKHLFASFFGFNGNFYFFEAFVHSDQIVLLIRIVHFFVFSKVVLFLKFMKDPSFVYVHI